VTDESILHFIRSMTATEQRNISRPLRYEVRGQGEHYRVWDHYLLQDVDDLEHGNHVAHYVGLAHDLNADEAATQHDYDKQLREMLDQRE
jgi:hypothetical protein